MKKILLSILFIFSILICWASNPSGDSSHTSAKDQKAEFNAGSFIIDHIVDSHEWHIATFGHTHITIPLPVVLIDEGKLITFSSSKFEHGHSSYEGYKIETEKGVNKGKIVKVVPGTMQTDTSANKPIDISLTKTVVGIFVSFLIMLIIFFSVSRGYKRNAGHAPRGLQSLLEPLIIFIRDEVAKPSIGKHYASFMPFLLTLFFFIFFANIIGLIPIFPAGANVTGNIGVTLVLALFTFIVITFKGNRSYWLHIFNAPGIPWWLKFPIPLIPVIELAGMFIKPFVLMVRLFANIIAGHIIIMGFMALIFLFGQISTGIAYGVSFISVLFSLFISILELLVAFIQAYVFTILSALYIGMATEDSHADVH